jgi:hypothetical protein
MKSDRHAFLGRVFRILVIKLFGKSIPPRYLPIDFRMISSLMM